VSGVIGRILSLRTSFSLLLTLSFFRLILMNKLEIVLLSDSIRLANNWYPLATVLATVVSVKVPCVNAKAVASYDHSPALWTISIFQRMAWNISKVGILQTLLLCNFIVLFKRFNWCVVKIHHLIVRMESQKVYWSIRPEFIMHESAKLSCCV
jgi:hypothetical protein